MIAESKDFVLGVMCSDGSFSKGVLQNETFATPTKISYTKMFNKEQRIKVHLLKKTLYLTKTQSTLLVNHKTRNPFGGVSLDIKRVYALKDEGADLQLREQK